GRGCWNILPPSAEVRKPAWSLQSQPAATILVSLRQATDRPGRWLRERKTAGVRLPGQKEFPRLLPMKTAALWLDSIRVPKRIPFVSRQVATACGREATSV